jgi:hypothetical protein
MLTAERPRTPIDLDRLDLTGLRDKSAALAKALKRWSDLWSAGLTPDEEAALLAHARIALAAVGAELDRLGLPRGDLWQGDLTGEASRRLAVSTIISSADNLSAIGVLQVGQSWGPPSHHRPFEKAAELLAEPVSEGAPLTGGTARVVRRPRASVNARMLETMLSNHDARGWSCKQWATYLKCAKSSVVETKAWKELALLRDCARAERRNDRRRRPKGSDQRRAAEWDE